VLVKQVPVTVVRRTFDPQNRPTNMPALAEDNLGLCQAEFTSEAQMKVEGRTGRSSREPARVASLEVTLRLDLVIWTIAEPSEKLRQHEETHREIFERYYAQAPSVAQRLAEGVVGRKLTVSIDSPAAKAEMDQLRAKLLADLQHETIDRCNRVQDEFDLITQHGSNSVSAAEGMAQALASDPNHP